MEELEQASGELDLVSLKKSYELEIGLYEKEYKSWEERAKKIRKRYRDERSQVEKGSKQDEARFNILWSNIQTMLPNVFARLPKPEVSRRYKDKDPIGRVASQILERALEFEVDAYSDYGSAVRNAVEDRLIPGRGVAWVRYEPTMKQAPNPALQEGVQISDDTPETVDVIDYECSPVDYVAWTDFGHNLARTWEEVHTVWRIVPLNLEELTERFGKEIAEKIPMDTKIGDKEQDVATPEEKSKMKANIYEIWDKAKGRVVWMSKKHTQVLDVKDDPLKLDEFFPCPKPLYATTTTNSLIPVPDYAIYQDLAKELDTLTDRINGLAESIKVVGVYDATQTGIKRMLKEGVNTELIPVDNWAVFGEKGGVKGVIDWLPLDQVVIALDAAYKARYEAKQAVFEIMGIADVLRGSSDPNETLGAQQLKGQFASKRLKFMQSTVATFATHLLCLKAQIICNHYQPQTIVTISGAMQMPEEDQQLIPQAIELLKNDVMSDFRIEVSSDSLIEMDEQAEKQNRMEFLTAVGEFVDRAQNSPPQLVPVLGEMLLFMVRGFKTGKSLEGQIDEAIEGLKEMAKQPPPPNPEMQKLEIEKQKIQMSQQTEQAKLANEQGKMAGDQQNAQLKANNEFQIAQNKEQTMLQLEQEKIASQERIAMNKDRLNAEIAIRKAKIDKQAALGQVEDKEIEETFATKEESDEQKMVTDALADALTLIQQKIAELQVEITQNKEKTVTSQKTGNVYHIRSGK